MKTHTSAGCYLLRKTRDSYELLVIYRKWPNGVEKYVLPKGHQQEGETLEETALRETSEETGYINIKLIKPLGTNSYFLHGDKENYKTDHYYLAILLNDKQENQKLTERELASGMKVEWKSVEKAFKLLSWENEERFLKQIQEYINHIR